MKQNQLGFWELSPKPTKDELANLYKQQYFNGVNFDIKYSDEEQFHKQIPYMEAEYIYNQYNPKNSNPSDLKFLDVGCGEAFSLNYFSNKGWQVCGTDYTDLAVKRHFPNFVEKVIIGDTEEILAQMINSGKKFDLINLNNVLEHLINPLEVMEYLKALLTPSGCVRVQVPNDFSAFQKVLLEKKIIDREFWVVPLEHLNYFEKNSLMKVFTHIGFSKLEVLADFPIDLSLLNPDTNYIMDKAKGKNCHLARVAADNFLARKAIKDLVAFRKGCGESGLGRNVIVYGQL